MTDLRDLEGKVMGALRILNLEDSLLDTELMQAHLSESGISCELVRVQTRGDFAAALEEGGFDLILADHALPNFDGRSALEMARKIRPEVPFILVSGIVGEEVAIEILKRGATDYVLKHRMERLVPAVRRAMREAEERSERERAEEALRRSEQQFRTLVEQIPAATYTQKMAEPQSSRTNPTLYASPQIEAQSGYPPQAFVEDPELWISLLHPADRERVLAEDRRTDETGEPFRIEYRMITRDGRVLWIRDEAVLVRDEEGRPRFWQGVMFDITEGKQTEEALRESEERFRALVQYGSDIVTILEADGTIRYQSPSIERVLGYRPEDLTGENAFDNIHPEDIEPALNTFAEVLSGAAVRAEFRFRHADSSWRYIEGIGNNLLDDPSVRGIVVTSRDVTERKQAEEALRRSEAGLAEAQRMAHLGSWEWDLSAGEVLWSDEVFRIYGFELGECIPSAEKVIELVHPEDRELLREKIEGALRRGEPYDFEHRIVQPGGQERVVHWQAEVVFDEEGKPLRMVGTVHDITDRKRTEEALKQSEELYRNVIEQAAENIVIVDVQSKRILEANAAVQRSLGYAPEEFKQLTIYDIVAHDRESVDLNIERIVEQGRYFIGERRYRCKDGALVDVEVNASTVAYGGREALCIVAHDLTERKRAEHNLRQSLSVLLSLREAGQILGSTLSSDEIVSRLLEIMRGVSRLTAAVISVPNEDGELHIWHSAGLGGLRRLVRFEQEAEAARRATLEDENPHLFRLHGSGSEDGHLVGLCLPLRTKDRVFGVLEAYGKESLADSDTVEILTSLTSQAASALENARLYEELGERERVLQDLVEKLLRAQEEERRRVAYEVHDELAQVAVAAHQRLQAFARRHSPGTERGRRDLDRILGLVRATVSDARRIIANLRPTALDDLGLAATLSLEVEHLREDGYQVDYEESLGDERLPDPVEITLFRVAQEALTNMRKHAQTRQVRIQLQRQGEEARLEVRDYGRGFDPDAVSVGSGPGERVGLAGLRERVGMLGGELEIDSRRDGGTSIAASVPLTQAS